MRDLNSSGFTVIELLISTAILAIMIAGLTVALMQQQRQFNFTKEAVDIDQTARASLDFISTHLRNAAAKQGKDFSVTFFNGGTDPDISPICSDNTDKDGTVNSAPDCLVIYTWDISEEIFTQQNVLTGTSERVYPSVSANIEIVSAGPPLILRLPNSWFRKPDGTLFSPPLIESGDYLGFKTRGKLCSPNVNVNCVGNPERCSECSAILKVSSVDSGAMTATINDDASLIVEHNSNLSFSGSLSTFVNSFFVPTFGAIFSEMTQVDEKIFRVDVNDKVLRMSQNGGAFQPLAGGDDSPGIVDLQFVFNLQGSDGEITKVGVPTDTANRMFSDFEVLEQQNNPTLGTVKDIRTVEIILVVRSRIRPKNLGGGYFEQNLPAIGDVPNRTVQNPSDADEPKEGFIYRVLSTTVYVRNMAREEFG